MFAFVICNPFPILICSRPIPMGQRSKMHLPRHLRTNTFPWSPFNWRMLGEGQCLWPISTESWQGYVGCFLDDNAHTHRYIYIYIRKQKTATCKRTYCLVMCIRAYPHTTKSWANEVANKMISHAFVLDDGHDVTYQSRTILPKRTQHLITPQTVQWQIENQYSRSITHVQYIDVKR